MEIKGNFSIFSISNYAWIPSKMLDFFFSKNQKHHNISQVSSNKAKICFCLDVQAAKQPEMQVVH